MSYNLTTVKKLPVKKLTDEEIKKILNFLNEFFNKYQEKLEAVNEGVSKSNYKELNDFYNHVYSKNWKRDLELAENLYKFYNKHKTTIILSLRQILTKRQKTEIDQKIQKSIPFLKIVGNSNSDLSYESDSWFPLPPYEADDLKTITKYKTSFIQPKTNIKPNLTSARDKLVEKNDIKLVTNGYFDNQDILKVIPSNARNNRKAIELYLLKYKDWNKFLPKHYDINLYDKDQGKKHYNRPGTWMFDIIYFSDFNTKVKRKQAMYLVGININTRYAVGRRINGKKADDLIKAFIELLANEFNQDEYDENSSNELNLLIFDGERAISSLKFKDFCNKHKINVKITSPGIHTQTAPIDRLCRTLRDYYNKMYLSNLFEGTGTNIKQLIADYKKNPIKNYNTFKEKMTTEGLFAREMFDGESDYYIPPIPCEYARCEDDYENIKYYIIGSEINGFKITKEWCEENYPYVNYYDELYDVIDYYNKKPHHGLINILRKASSLFNLNLQIKNDEIILPKSEDRFNLDDYDYEIVSEDDSEEIKIHLEKITPESTIDTEKITPQFVNENKGLELIIIKYCQYYNKYIAKPSYQFNIGDKVKVYDCFTSERGKLLRNRDQTLMGDWEIVEKDGEIYGVYNNINNRLLHVSKYMIKPERT